VWCFAPFLPQSAFAGTLVDFDARFPPREMGKHEVLRDSRVWAWDDMSTGPLCELFHTLVIFSGVRQTHLALRQADQARTDFAAIESERKVIQKQLTRLVTRRELAGSAFGIRICLGLLSIDLP
jgi:hypothetical protein